MTEDLQLHTSREAAQGLDSQSQAAQNHGAQGAACACGEHPEGIPEVDVQTIPHSVRHAAIFGMIDALNPGFALILSATHNPLPLLQQLQQRSPGLFETQYLEEGPERWRLSIRRNHN